MLSSKTEGGLEAFFSAQSGISDAAAGPRSAPVARSSARGVVAAFAATARVPAREGAPEWAPAIKLGREPAPARYDARRGALSQQGSGAKESCGCGGGGAMILPT